MDGEEPRAEGPVVTNLPSAYAAVLGNEPGEVVRPETVEAVAEIVAAAQAAGKSIVPWGGGMGQDYGTTPRRVDILLDLSALNRVVAIEPGDMTITVEAGTTLAAIRDALMAHSQFLPLDPPGVETATVGGVLATNAFGPLRLGYGIARDWLIGLRVVDARGRIIHGGGKVVKNVTGYDLPKMHIGALGTLGVIVEATFKTSPQPEAVRTLIVRLDESGDLATFLANLQKDTSPVQILLHEDADGRFAVILFHGPGEAVEEAAAKSHALSQSARFPAATVYEEELTPGPSGAALAVRLSARPANALTVHRAAQAEAGSAASLETQIGVGITTIAWRDDTEDARQAVRRLMALARLKSWSATLLHGPLALRTGDCGDLWFPLPPALPLMQRLKDVLDPDAILNPGRFVGGI